MANSDIIDGTLLNDSYIPDQEIYVAIFAGNLFLENNILTYTLKTTKYL